MSLYPEHDKLAALERETDAIVAFIESDEFAKWGEANCHEPLVDVVRRFYGISNAKLEFERKAMIESLANLGKEK